jgi:type I restriction enzyme S subunit
VKLPQRLKQTAIAEVLGSLDDRINSNLRVSHAAERLAVGKLAQLDRTVLLADIAESRREVRTDFDNTIVDHFSLPAFDAGRLPERCIGSSIKSGKSLMTGVEAESTHTAGLARSPRARCNGARIHGVLCSSP